MASVFAPLLFWFSAVAVAQSDTSVGGRVDDAIVLDITEEGFEQLTPAVDGVVPSPIEPGTITSGPLTVSGLAVDVDVDSVQATPRNDALDLVVETTIAVNSNNDPARLTATVGITLGCDFYIEPFPATLTTTATFDLVPDPNGVDFDRDNVVDTKRLDADIAPIVADLQITGDDIRATNGCTLESIDNLLGGALFNLLVNNVLPGALDGLTDGLDEDLEPIIEAPFEGFALADEINVLGVPLFVALWPDTLLIDRDGLSVGLASFVDAPADPCVDRYGIDTYAASSAPVPSAPYPQSPFAGPHVAGFVDDDFANLAMWATWSGGLLCLDLTDPDNAFDLPLALDSSLLELLGPEGIFDHLFEETVPIELYTDPKAPPVADLNGEEDVTVLIDPLGLVIEADVAGRRSRVLDIEVTGRLGADLSFDGQTGDLALGLTEIGPSTIEVALAHNDFAPDADTVVADAVTALLVDVAGPLLDEQLAGASLAITVPSFDGFGLTRLETAASASDGSILGAYAEVGAVSYQGLSCTDPGGCDQGCTSSGAPTGTSLGIFGALVLVVLRRRRH